MLKSFSRHCLISSSPPPPSGEIRALSSFQYLLSLDIIERYSSCLVSGAFESTAGIFKIKNHQRRGMQELRRHRCLLRGDSERQSFTEQSIKGTSFGLAMLIKQSFRQALTHGSSSSVVQSGMYRLRLKLPMSWWWKVGELALGMFKGLWSKARYVQRVVLIHRQNMASVSKIH